MTTHILLVEDSPSDAAMLLAAFEDCGYQGNIQVESDGVKAIQALEDSEKNSQCKRPGLILLDLNLPKKSGLEVLEEVKQNQLWKQIPIIVLSSSSAKSDIDKSYQLHANAYLPKPKKLADYQAIAQQLYAFWLRTVSLPAQ